MENSLTFIQTELEKARERLKGVEDSIKKNIGRTITSPPNRNVAFKRRISDGVPGEGVEAQRPRLMTDGISRGRGGRLRPGAVSLPSRFGVRNPEERISAKKRLGEQVAVTVFSRLSGPPKDDDYEKKEESISSGGRHEVKLTSHVVPTQDLPSRKEVLAAQAGDNQCRARNKRMFGALLGTLHKFRQEENQLKEKEQKRAQVEKKLEDAANKEKEDMKKKRQELFLNRRQQQFEIKQLEFKLMRLKQLSEWEATRKHLLNFIQTKTSPKIFWHPKIHTDKTEKLLEETKKSINRTIEAKRAEVEKSIADHHMEQKANEDKSDSNEQKRDAVESSVTINDRRAVEEVVERSEEIQIPQDFVIPEDMDDDCVKEETVEYKNHEEEEEDKEGHSQVSMVDAEIPLPDEPSHSEAINGELEEEQSVNGTLSQPSPPS